MKRLPLTAFLALLIALPSLLGAQSPAPPAGDSLHLKVDGMVCSLCAYGAERRLKKVDNVERVQVELDSGLVVVVLQPGTAVSDSTLADEIRRAGFALREVRRFPRGQTPPKPEGER